MKPFGISVKTLAPGGIRTDFSGPNLDRTQHEDYSGAFAKAAAIFLDPDRDANRSSAEQIAEATYEAVTDGTDQVTYVAGADAQGAMALREQLGQTGFLAASTTLFFGD